MAPSGHCPASAHARGRWRDQPRGRLLPHAGYTETRVVPELVPALLFLLLPQAVAARATAAAIAPVRMATDLLMTPITSPPRGPLVPKRHEHETGALATPGPYRAIRRMRQSMTAIRVIQSESAIRVRSEVCVTIRTAAAPSPRACQVLTVLGAPQRSGRLPGGHHRDRGRRAAAPR